MVVKIATLILLIMAPYTIFYNDVRTFIQKCIRNYNADPEMINKEMIFACKFLIIVDIPTTLLLGYFYGFFTYEYWIGNLILAIVDLSAWIIILLACLF